MPMFYLSRNDLLPDLSVTPRDSLGYAVAVPDGATVVFSMVSMDGKTLKVLRQPATASGGTLTYEWQEGDTDTAGDFRAEFEWDNGGLPQTFPNNEDDRLIVRIHPDVG